MLTALSVRVPEKREKWSGWRQRLRRDRVEVETRQARGVTLRHVTYTSYSGQLRLDKLDSAVGARRDGLLCSDKLIFPRQSGYRRFSSTAFSSRLCTNFALSILQACKNAGRLRVALYDPAAYCADYLFSLLEICADVTVVTSCFEPYFYVADRALNELGAAALVTKNRGELKNRDVIIAPRPVAEAISVEKTALVFTVARPCGQIGGTVFDRYQFRMPNGFAQLKPAELSEEYFCSALYTLGAQYELGSIVPLSAAGSGGERDLKTLANLLDKRR